MGCYENPSPALSKEIMQESYGHRITAIHANPNNLCDRCRKPALWETDYKMFGENQSRGSNPEQVCDTHAKEFEATWPSAHFPVQRPK